MHQYVTVRTAVYRLVLLWCTYQYVLLVFFLHCCIYRYIPVRTGTARWPKVLVHTITYDSEYALLEVHDSTWQYMAVHDSAWLYIFWYVLMIPCWYVLVRLNTNLMAVLLNFAPEILPCWKSWFCRQCMQIHQFMHEQVYSSATFARGLGTLSLFGSGR